MPEPFEGLPLDPTEGLAPTDQSRRIPLAEVPEPRTPASRKAFIHPVERPSIPLPEIEVPPDRPSRMAPVKALIKQFYFDPAHAFESQVDWGKFRNAQLSLFMLSLVMPFLVLLFTGFLLGVIYLTGASLYDAAGPNPIYELMLYPLVFVLARGYWIAFIVLPAGLFIVGWIWSAATAWVLSKINRGAHINFRKAFAILAMFSAMLAPLTTFPFLRLVALLIILWVLVKRLEDTFDIGFWSLLSRCSLIFLVAASLYGAFERKVESDFPGGEELQVNLNAFVRQHKRLVWPTFQHGLYVGPHERLYADLSDASSEVRASAAQKAMGILKAGSGTSEFRFRIAKRMAENGQEEACLFMSRFCADGQGTPPNASEALFWIQKYTKAFPKDLDAGLEQARLLFACDRQLEGKRWLVGLAKNNLPVLFKITDFMQKQGWGRNDVSLNSDIQSLYQFGNSFHLVSRYNRYSSTSDYSCEPETKQQALIKQLASEDQDASLWFYKAMASEYSSSTVAGPEVYDESPSAFGQTELAVKVQEGDPVAMDILADRSAQAGDVTQARRYWIAATQALNDDNRFTNAGYYMKLGDSYDPGTSQTATDPHEAIRYYLAALLTSSWYGRNSPVSTAPLERLLHGPAPDPMGQPFLDLCVKYDVPEAWVIMGSRYLNGDFPGVPKNIAKSKSCFQKARALGYKGPQFTRQLALMESKP